MAAPAHALWPRIPPRGATRTIVSSNRSQKPEPRGPDEWGGAYVRVQDARALLSAEELKVRRLFAGGGWIRTISSAPDWQRFAALSEIGPSARRARWSAEHLPAWQRDWTFESAPLREESSELRV